MGRREIKYQGELMERIREMWPGVWVIRQPPIYVQGIPDVLVLYGSMWAMLECKADAKAPYEPNQEYYLEVFNDMSFASVIYPEIEGRVLDALQQAFGIEGPARLPFAE